MRSFQNVYSIQLTGNMWGQLTVARRGLYTPLGRWLRRIVMIIEPQISEVNQLSKEETLRIERTINVNTTEDLSALSRWRMLLSVCL